MSITLLNVVEVIDYDVNDVSMTSFREIDEATRDIHDVLRDGEDIAIPGLL